MANEPVSGGEVPGDVQLGVGESLELRLPGLGTAGYVWEHGIDGDEQAVDVSWRRGAPDVASMPVGASVPETVVLRGLKPGKVNVQLRQRRPWERDTPPVSRHEIQVTVTPSPAS